MAESETRELIRELMGRPEFRSVVEAAAAEDQEEDLYRKSDEYADDLLSAFQRYSEPSNFEPGAIVEWKAGMKNRRYPEYGEPAVVVRLVSPPLAAESADAGSQYFQEELDIAIGVLDSDGDFSIYHVPSHRFERREASESIQLAAGA